MIRLSLEKLSHFRAKMSYKIDLYIKIFIFWKYKYLSERQFILLLSILVGLSSGIAAVLLKNMVHLIKVWVTGISENDITNIAYFIFPGIGILITGLIVKYALKGKIAVGVPSTLYAISKLKSRMSRRATYASLVTSMITVGLGGSVGLEGPTVGASSAIGSNLARKGRVNYKNTTLLLGCGAAAAMSGIFNAPIAAIVFALEVIMLDLTAGSLIPLLMASVSAALTSSFILGEEVLFNIEVIERFTIGDLPFYILLGVFSGLVSVYFCKSFWFIETAFEKIKGTYRKMLFGSIILGVLIFIFPPLYGEGFGAIKSMLDGNVEGLTEDSFFSQYSDKIWIVIGFLFLLAFFKAIATSVTLGAGGIGGVFAPSLFIGSVVGFAFAKLVNLLGWFNLSERNFTLVGMGGVIAGIIHAPLTALFLIAEITGGYELVIPLMLTAAISFMTSKYFNQHSLYTLQLAKRGELITHNKDKAVLTLMQLKTEVETDFHCVYETDSLRQLVKVVSHSRRNIFPVISKENGHLAGVILLDDIRQMMFRPELYDQILAAQIMSDYEEYVSPNDSMDMVMDKFNRSGAWNLPVIENNRYVGFVSKSKLFNAYRKVLKQFSDE